MEGPGSVPEMSGTLEWCPELAVLGGGVPRGTDRFRVMLGVTGLCLSMLGECFIIFGAVPGASGVLIMVLGQCGFVYELPELQ